MNVDNENIIEIQLTGIRFPVKILVVSTILLLLLIPLMLIPSINELFVDWAQIPAENWLRLISAIILTSFLPGFFTLKLIIRNDKISTLATIALSYILSMFITPLLYFIATISFHELFFWLVAGYILSSFILILLRENKQRKQIVKTRENQRTFSLSILIHDRTNLLILVSVSMLWLFGFLAIYITSQLRGSFFIPGVNQNHFNWSLSFMKDFPWWLYYSWWFHAHLASFFTLSGFPLINAYLALSIFSPVTVAFIYLMGKAFVKNKNIAVLATIFASFQGFGWIYFILRRLTPPDENLFQSLWDISLKSRDIIGGVVLLPNTFSPIFFVGIPTFLALLFVMYSDDFSTSSKYILVTLLTSLLCLSHGGYEVLLFTAISAMLCIFDRRIRTIDFPLAVLLGLSFVALIDIVSPTYNYIMSINTHGTSFWIPSSLYLGSVIISVITYATIRIFNKRNLNLSLSSIWNVFSGKIFGKLSLLIIIYLYVIFWLTWIRVLPSFDENNVYVYSYPVRFGINMIFVILGFYFLFNEENRELQDRLSILLVCSAAPLLIAPFLRQINLLGLTLPLPPINEHRLNTYSLIFISFVSSYAFLKILHKSRHKRNSFCKIFGHKKTLALLTLLVTSGVLSTTFYFYGFSLLGYTYPVKASKEELEALNYLRVYSEPDKTVLTISGQSRGKIATYTGLTNPMLYQTKDREHWHHLVSTPSPEMAFYLLNKYRMKYVYLTLDDLTLLEKQFSNSFLIKLIKFLPIFFKNDYVTILEIPEVSYPDLNSTFNIIAPLETVPTLLDLYASLKSSENLQVSSCDTLDFVGTTRAQAIIDTEDKNEGNASIKVTTIGPMDKESIVYFLTAYMPQRYRKVASWEKLFFWFKSSASNITVEVGISAWGKGQSFWRFTYRNADEWQGIVVPLRKPDGCYVSPADYRNVSLIEIKVRPPLTENTTFNIDDLFFSSYTYDPIITSYESLVRLSSLSRWNYSTSFATDPFAFGSEVVAIPFDPPTDTYGYLDYVEHGGKLVVFNTLGQGVFSKILSVAEPTNSTYVDTIITLERTYELHPLEVPITLTLDKNTSVLAFWATNNSVKTPFIFFRPYGNGSIYYVEAPFLPSILTNGTHQTLSNTVEIGNLLNDLLPEINVFTDEGVNSIYDYQKKGLSWFSYTTDDVTVSGLINIKSDGLIFPRSPINVGIIKYSNHTGEFSTQNSSILSLKVIGKYKVELSVSRAVVKESEVAPYLFINVQEPCNITLLPLDRGEIHIVVQRNGLKEEIVARELYLNCAIIDNIILRSPLLSFKGIMMLKDTWIWPGNLIKSFHEPLTLEGEGTIRFVLAGQNFTYLSVLDFSGSTTVLTEKALIRNEIADLSETLSSNPGLLVNAVFILIFTKIILSSSRLKYKFAQSD